jgi:hypothetical protein
MDESASSGAGSKTCGVACQSAHRRRNGPVASRAVHVEPGADARQAGRLRRSAAPRALATRQMLRCPEGVGTRGWLNQMPSIEQASAAAPADETPLRLQFMGALAELFGGSAGDARLAAPCSRSSVGRLA